MKVILRLDQKKIQTSKCIAACFDLSCNLTFLSFSIRPSLLQNPRVHCVALKFYFKTTFLICSPYILICVLYVYLICTFLNTDILKQHKKCNYDSKLFHIILVVVKEVHGFHYFESLCSFLCCRYNTSTNLRPEVLELIAFNQLLNLNSCPLT